MVTMEPGLALVSVTFLTVERFLARPQRGLVIRQEAHSFRKWLTSPVFASEKVAAGEVKVLEDGWTAVTLDRQPSVHFEHTICITESGCEVLTKP